MLFMCVYYAEPAVIKMGYSYKVFPYSFIMRLRYVHSYVKPYQLSSTQHRDIEHVTLLLNVEWSIWILNSLHRTLHFILYAYSLMFVPRRPYRGTLIHDLFSYIHYIRHRKFKKIKVCFNGDLCEWSVIQIYVVPKCLTSYNKRVFCFLLPTA